MQGKHILFLASLLLIENSANAYQRIRPDQSQCLESVINQALDSLRRELHVTRDSTSGLVTDIVDLDTSERFVLDYIEKLDDDQEFISFANPEHLLNIFGRRNAGPTCVLEKVEVLPNYKGHFR